MPRGSRARQRRRVGWPCRANAAGTGVARDRPSRARCDRPGAASAADARQCRCDIALCANRSSRACPGNARDWHGAGLRQRARRARCRFARQTPAGARDHRADSARAGGASDRPRGGWRDGANTARPSHAGQGGCNVRSCADGANGTRASVPRDRDGRGRRERAGATRAGITRQRACGLGAACANRPGTSRPTNRHGGGRAERARAGRARRARQTQRQRHADRAHGTRRRHASQGDRDIPASRSRTNATQDGRERLGASEPCHSLPAYAMRIRALLASLTGMVNVKVPAVTVCEPNV
jgi:hypothetical protein